MNISLFGTWLHLVTTITTFTSTLLSLKVFIIIVVVMVGLVQNMF